MYSAYHYPLMTTNFSSPEAEVVALSLEKTRSFRHTLSRKNQSSLSDWRIKVDLKNSVQLSREMILHRRASRDWIKV